MFAAAKHARAAAKLNAIERSQATIAFALDGTVTEANPNFLALMGYRLEEVRGRHHRLFVDPAEAEGDAYKAFWDSLRRGEFQSAEYKRLAKGGREVWIRATYNPVLDTRGRTIQIIKFALDITAEKRASTEAAGQIAAIHRSQAVIHFDLDGTVEDANSHFLEALGYEIHEVRGRPHRMFVDEDHAASPEYRAFWEALAGGAYRSGEFKRLGKGGREVWIQASYNPILDASGRPIKVVKYATDITAAKLAAADMAGQVQAAGRSQAVIQFDMDGVIQDANANFLDALGYELDEIKGQHHRMFVTQAYAASAAYAAFWTDLRAGKYSSAVYPRIGKGGRVVWIQATYNPVLDLGGRPFKVVKFATDVTRSMAVRARAIAAAEQTLNRVQAVASASEEMHTTSAAIARQMMQSQEAVGEIQERVAGAGAATEKLGQAAQAMNGVVDAITSIAEKINLLALNATIEAARAGAAGRGFAVVAAEVKNLAGQAQAATTRISGEIAAMQSVSREVGAALVSIRGAVDAVQGFVAQTAAASEQQRATTGEVSTNVQTTATGVAGIARNLDEWLVGVEERRSDERIRTSIPATIEVPPRAGDGPGGAEPTRLPCIIINISESGAKLSVDGKSVPEIFLLHAQGGPPRTCRVMRRQADEVGVRFEAA
ncbi:hypothetical protein OPKNFCMD_0982 [Methylobacterium crusticola]|uniref:PAS domain S-box protein n=1 Tax=Methylobacterium crusticola TaxID=1697972 RepID=A0ABQ4QU24_9HYPH|nr:PAS domain-containing protein [Methylobacterium crusticola]GJD48265.1 hypothetical protein OPKNFCMD_0982 [Methylobacterium crusticola]